MSTIIRDGHATHPMTSRGALSTSVGPSLTEEDPPPRATAPSSARRTRRECSRSPVRSNPADGKLFACAARGRSFRRKYDAERHERGHYDDERIACDVEDCAYRSSRLDKVRDHQRNVHAFVR